MSSIEFTRQILYYFVHIYFNSILEKKKNWQFEGKPRYMQLLNQTQKQY